MGNETITEVDSTGRKVKTFIKAAGAEIAWQKTTTDISNNTQTQAVFFEHSDASGLSQRATDTSGAQLTTEGADGAPVEADALGGNTGLSTPYIDYSGGDNGGVDYADRILPILGLESHTYVDGQRVTCNLDGMEMGCSKVFNLMSIGAAVPKELEQAQHLPDFTFEDHGFGMFSYSFYGSSYEERGTGRDVRNHYTIYGIIPWDIIVQQNPQIAYYIDRRRDANKLVDSAESLLNSNPDCENFINKFLENLAAVTGVSAGGNIRDILKQFRENGVATINKKNVEGGGSYGVTDYKSNVAFIPSNYVPAGNSGLYGILAAALMNNADNGATAIHEIIHAMISAYSDTAMAKAGEKMGVLMSIKDFMEKEKASEEIDRDTTGASRETVAARFLASDFPHRACEKRYRGWLDILNARIK